jgi:hypothetical protein
LVDELLTASREHEIQLGWQAGRCQVNIPQADPPERIEVAVQKSVMRAVLARVAVLCNERVPNSVSPYRGRGEVAIDPATVLRVNFVNTPDEQTLELSPAGLTSPQQAEGPSPAAVEKSGPLPDEQRRHAEQIANDHSALRRPDGDPCEPVCPLPEQ